MNSSAPLAKIVSECTELLNPHSFSDSPGAVNGLQVQNRGTVHKIAAAVDASLSTIRAASDIGADLLLVHHGLFWGKTVPWTGRRYDLLRHLLDHDLAVYSSHLPLDAHPELGNNALLARALNLKNPKPFFHENGTPIGLRFKKAVKRDRLHEQLNRVLGKEALMIPGGPEQIRQVGIVTGGAGNQIPLAAKEGVDTFITGEGAHWTYALAEDLGLNVFYGGHYATETFGVKALADHLSARFGIPWEFVDYPTGL